MMRLLFIPCFLLYYAPSIGSIINDIDQVRLAFNLAVEDGKKASILYDQLSQMKPANNTLHYAYLGATEALLAKHSINPFSKLSYVNSALVKLNKAVVLNSTNIEIRYMRFSVEVNMPAYLGYSKHIGEDKLVLLEGLKNTQLTKDNCDMHKVFAIGILNSNNCNKEERILLSTIVDACNRAKQIKN